jgi:cyclopropane-fatty-acyl-phospholipid synthase
MNNFKQLSQFASDLVDRGPLYAIANHRIHAPIPLEPVENWQFWTEPKPGWLESLIRSYPPESKRKAYLEAMLTQNHATGIEAHYDVSNEFYALFLDTQYKFHNMCRISQRSRYFRGSTSPQGRIFSFALAANWA